LGALTAIRQSRYATPPKDKPSQQRDPREPKQERPQRDQRPFSRRHFHRRLLAAQLLSCALPPLKLALDMSLPPTELGTDERQSDERRRAE
jgi:hypothetical protein